MLNNIKQSTGVDGCVLTAENLLYFADAIKGGTVKRTDFINLFGKNDELVYPYNLKKENGRIYIKKRRLYARAISYRPNNRHGIR